MWFLRSVKGEMYYLLPGKHTVGRKGCNLILEGDASISRNHAVIEVLQPQEKGTDILEQPIATAADTGSKYGTCLLSASGSEKLTSDPKRLSNGDEIHFGLQWNKWKVCCEPLIVVMSSLTRQEKQSVKLQVAKLGGIVVNDWLSEVTYLTMSSITLTVKAICALASAKPIVSPQFWQEYVAAVQARHEPPKYEDFVPPLNESNINKHEVSLLVNPQRSTLFKGKTFAFFSELQFKEHGCLVTAAGGETKFISDYVIKPDEFMLPNIVVMLHLSAVGSQNTMRSQSSQVPPSFFKLCDVLKSNGKRAVPSSEIGLAILHCSIEKFCNPEFSFSSMFLRNSDEPNKRVFKEEILATETQDLTQAHFVNSSIIIPDSGTETRIGGAALAAEVTGVDDDSNTEMPRESQSQSCSSEPVTRYENGRIPAAKRVIEESEDEAEVLPPLKKTPRDKTPENKVKQTTRSSSRRSAASSRVSMKQSSEAVEDLFSDFQETQHKSRTCEPSRIKEEVENVFAGFEDDSLRQTQRKRQVPPTPPKKRELSSDDEDDRPPLKRLETLELAEEKPLNTQQSGGSQEEQEFISVPNVKEETMDKPSFNVTVIVKSLMIVRNLNATSTSSSSSSTVDENIRNFKRFKKVKPLNNSIIPRIIGGADLKLYKSGIRTMCESVLQDSDSEEEGRPGSLWQEVTQTKPSKSKSSKISSWVKRR